MTGVYLQQVILEGKREETFDQRARLKLEAIKKMLEGTPPNVAYAETSHMFVKTFSDVLLDKLGNVAKVSVVFLHRPAKDTVWSQLRLGWFSDGHSGKNMWYYDVNDVHESEQQMSFKTNSSSAIDSLIGYNADVLQRGVELEREINRRRKKGEWKHVRVFESFLSSISGTKQDGVLKLFRRLGLEADMDKLKLLNAQDTNSRDVKKDRYSMKSSPKDVEKRLDYLSDKLPLLKQVMYN